LGNVVETLNHLERAVNLQLRLPVVILDATKSSDRQDVLATVSDNPDNPTGHFNYMRVPQGNGRFRKLGVRRGDRVRYFVTNPFLAAQIAVYQSSWFIRRVRQGTPTDPAVFQRRVEQEMQRQTESHNRYLERTVRRVVDDGALLLDRGFPVAISQPQRIEVWRDANDKAREITKRVNRYIRGSSNMIGWEPSPDEAAIDRLIDRLNYWIRQQPLTEAWRPDPIVDTLPAGLRAMVTEEPLTSTTFLRQDGQYFQQAVWLRDIARWAHGESLSDLDRARALFDWTVRHIQLESRPSHDQRPWQTLLYGCGNADERVWVFLLLCRQQGLDVVMLARPDPEDKTVAIGWVPALLSDGQFYLFEPRLGLPIPGPGGTGVATLAQVRADDSLLRQLDLDAEHPYPVAAADLKEISAWIAAAPQTLSRRMQLVESHLTGNDRMVLVVNPTALAERLRQTGAVGSVALWTVPWQTIARQGALRRSQRRRAAEAFRIFTRQPALWKARVLHFQGTFNGDAGAKAYYRMVRLPDSMIRKLPKGANPAVVRRAKRDASYWLGLLAYDDAEPAVSVDYLRQRVLRVDAGGPWDHGARYNLGRAYEKLGQIDKARALYLEAAGPQRDGNILRARRLKGEPAMAKQDPAGGAPEDAP